MASANGVRYCRAMELNFPPSLEPAVLERAWSASNKELGICPDDVNAFLDACEQDGVPVLGWEMWVVKHASDLKGEVEQEAGSWAGLVPGTDGLSGVWHGEGDAKATRAEISELRWRSEIPVELHPYIRFNFTLDA